MRNLTPHDKRVRLKGKPLVVSTLTQVYYEAVDPSYPRKAWISHVKGSRGWSVSGCTTEHDSSDTPGGLEREGTLKKADAIEAAAWYIIHGYSHL